MAERPGTLGRIGAITPGQARPLVLGEPRGKFHALVQEPAADAGLSEAVAQKVGLGGFPEPRHDVLECRERLVKPSRDHQGIGYWGKQGPELLDHRLALYAWSSGWSNAARSQMPTDRS
jgi:hypothetical protein